MTKSQRSEDILGKLSRAANTIIEDKGHLAYDLANDLLVALSLPSYTDQHEMISSSPVDNGDIDLFRNSYLRAELLSKYDGHTLGINTEAVAWEKFLAAERVCGETNKRLSFEADASNFNLSAGESCIHMARQKIRSLLGEVFPFGEMLSHCRFSGGASTTNNRNYGHPSFKFARPQECTPRALPYVLALRENVSEDIRISDIVPFNKATTVPKNSKTDRCIAIEPGWNMFFQLGCGGVLRRRLKRWSIDLNDQSVNQRLAKSGSIDGTLATIDLSAASDSISLKLVELLLPPSWYKVLTDLRSDYGKLPNGEIVTYEKISSMGNGFTFELESLIFAALARTVCDMLNLDPSTVSVYGDDIILPSQAAALLIDVFTYCGFSTNTKKSFFEGNFRESCGKHYYSGVDVSPFYIRSPIVKPHDLILVLNQIYRWSTIDGVWDPRVYPVYQKYRKLLPNIWRRNVIPDGYGDGALVGSFSANPFMKDRRWIRYYPVAVEHTRDRARDEVGAYRLGIFDLSEERLENHLRAFSRMPLDPISDTSTRITSSTGRYQVKWLACSSPVLAPFGIF